MQVFYLFLPCSVAFMQLLLYILFITLTGGDYMDTTNIGVYLKDRRISLKLTMKNVADYVGVSESTIKTSFKIRNLVIIHHLCNSILSSIN